MFLGGNTKYFVDNILHFHLLESTFDLAIMATVKVVAMTILFSVLEDVSLSQINRPCERQLVNRKRGLHAGCIIICIVTFAYAVTKGSLILNAILNDPAYPRMHLTYNILTISTIVFCFFELVLSLMSFGAMRRLKVMRMLHRLNAQRQEIDQEGEPVKKKANIGRLIRLAKPVGNIFNNHYHCRGRCRIFERGGGPT